MKKLKLCNVHRLAVSNEGEDRKPIHIPFGTWPYDDRVSQTLDREHAEKIANELAASVAKGEPGIPVYQGHPDVPEYAGKYPDKGALGWVKKILVNEDGMDLEVEWDRDPGKGFGWFSPYWTGDDPAPDASGKRNVVVDGLTSIGLVNNPNIREFRLANEAAASSASDVRPTYKMPQHLIDLAKRFDDRAALANVVDANGMGHSDENGQFDGSGSGGGGGSGGAGANRKTKSERATESFKRRMDEEGEVTELNELEAKYIKLSGGNPFDLSPEAEKALSDFNKKKADLQKRGIIEERIRGAKPGEGFRHKSTTDEMKRRTPVNMGGGRSSWTEEERKKFSDPTSHLKFVDLAKRFDDRAALANVVDANGMGHSDENGQFDGSGSGGGGGGSGGGAAKTSKPPHFGTKAYQREREEQSSRIDKLLGDAEADLARTKAKIATDRASRSKEREARHAAMEARIAEIRKKRLALKEFNDRTSAQLKTATGAKRAAIIKEMAARYQAEKN